MSLPKGTLTSQGVIVFRGEEVSGFLVADVPSEPVGDLTESGDCLDLGTGRGQIELGVEDRGGDLADVLVDQGVERLFARENASARFTDADRAQGIGLPRPPETWLGSFRTLQERCRRPVRLEGSTRGHAVDGLNDRPEHPRCSGEQQLGRGPAVDVGGARRIEDAADQGIAVRVRAARRDADERVTGGDELLHDSRVHNAATRSHLTDGAGHLGRAEGVRPDGLVVLPAAADLRHPNVVATLDVVYCGSGRPDRTLEVRLADLVAACNGLVAPISAPGDR